METATHAEQILQADRTIRDRKVTYVWKNQTLDKDWDGTPAGEQVEIELRHDTKRKQYTATIRLVWWQPNDRGFNVTMYAPFDNVTYPSSRFHSQGVNRYSDKSFAQFETDSLSIVSEVLHELENSDRDKSTDTVLVRLLDKVLTF